MSETASLKEVFQFLLQLQQILFDDCAMHNRPNIARRG